MEKPSEGLKVVAITYFPMAIAALSLVTSIFNGYLNSRFVDLIENNVARVEYMRTCKEIIDAYFVVKSRLVPLPAEAGGAGPARDTVQLREAIARFGALGTWLANLRDEEIRVRYSAMTSGLEQISSIPLAGRTPAELARRVQPIDHEFSALNADCVRMARSQRL